MVPRNCGVISNTADLATDTTGWERPDHFSIMHKAIHRQVCDMPVDEADVLMSGEKNEIVGWCRSVIAEEATDRPDKTHAHALHLFASFVEFPAEMPFQLVLRHLCDTADCGPATIGQMCLAVHMVFGGALGAPVSGQGRARARTGHPLNVCDAFDSNLRRTRS